MFEKNGNDKTNISAYILLVLWQFAFAEFVPTCNANGEIGKVRLY